MKSFLEQGEGEMAKYVWNPGIFYIPIIQILRFTAEKVTGRTSLSLNLDTV